ncbi:BID domain-containing protein [Castellaniella sp.]|uniref:BID domain-containing protein n=1 Tax=Castellaniella sp. TaxID=1955812 RepID=UPI002AFFFFE5|nr:BID domain-containing protein [Castellaniella sp.]
MFKEDWGDRHPVEAHRQEKLLVAVKVPDLTHDEVNSRALEAPRVHGAREQAEALGAAAYGEASGVTKMIREIDASTSPAALASEKARELRAAPETLGELPGRAGGWLRGPDQERKTALAAVTELANAIDKYGVTLAYERKQVVKEHVAEQKKMAVEIPAPSNALSAVLAMPVEKQANALQNAPVVAKELETLVQASEKRLSQAERRELSSGNTQSLEDRHDTSVARAHRLGKVLQQSTQLHEEHQKQVRQQSLNRNVGQALAR